VNVAVDSTSAPLLATKRGRIILVFSPRSHFEREKMMERRDVARSLLLGPAAAAALLSRNAAAQPAPGQTSFARTHAENAANVATPNESYPPGDVRRYGAIGDWDGKSGADDTIALQNALKCNASVFLPPGRFRTTSTLTIPPFVQVIGSGGDVCIINAQNCDGLSLAPTPGIGPTLLSGFAVMGTGSAGFVGIKCTGSSNPGDQVNGIRLENVRIQFFNTALQLRTFWHSTIRGCVFNHVYHGIRILGQSIKVTIDDCQIIGDRQQGQGGSVGVLVDATTDYDPGHKTWLRPEGIAILNNLIYDFDHGMRIATVLDSRVLHNELDYCTLCGIELGVCDGACNVQDNWIALNDKTQACGIRLMPVNIPATSVRNIRDNFIVATAAQPGSVGISVEERQNHCHIDGNTISGFTQADIAVRSAANTTLTHNRCGSAGATNSIVTAATKGMTALDGNFCAASILLGSNEDQTTPRVVTHQP
jgi:hypothetical protein